MGNVNLRDYWFKNHSYKDYTDKYSKAIEKEYGKNEAMLFEEWIEDMVENPISNLDDERLQEEYENGYDVGYEKGYSRGAEDSEDDD